MNIPKKGERYLNIYNEVHEIVSISDDNSTLIAIDVMDKQLHKFNYINYGCIGWYFKNGYGISKKSLGEKLNNKQ